MRNKINQFLHTHGIKGQKLIRKASWRHSELYNTDPLYREQADQLYLDIGTIPCAMSKQEAHHTTHLVNAIMICLLRPNTLLKLDKQKQCSSAKHIAAVTEYPEECTAYKNTLYTHLWSVIENYGKATSKDHQPIEEQIRSLELRVALLEQFTGIDEES